MSLYLDAWFPSKERDTKAASTFEVAKFTEMVKNIQGPESVRLPDNK